MINLIFHGEITGSKSSEINILRSSSGGGQGSGGGCFLADTMIWTKNESMPDTYASERMVKDVIEGHLLGTLDTSALNEGRYKFMWTRATDVTIYHEVCKAHNFSFSSDRGPERRKVLFSPCRQR